MIEKMFFPVPLTDRELLTAANYSGMLSKTIAEKEAEFAEIKAKHRESLRELKEALALQMDLLGNRKETREVDVEILFNTPAEGKKTFRDPVTHEVWEVADMTEDDHEDLFVNTELNPTEEDEKEDAPVSTLPEDDAATKRRKGIPSFTGNTMAAALSEEESGKPTEVCSVCKECHYVLHIMGDKPICGICRDKKNLNNLKYIDEIRAYWENKGQKPAFRAICGNNWDTTCFKFMLGSGSWGNPVYLAGDYTYEGSQAFSFYNNLLKNGWAEA